MLGGDDGDDRFAADSTIPFVNLVPLCGQQTPLQKGAIMLHDTRLINDQFPRSSKYSPDWIVAAAGSGANTLWITEWLASAMPLFPGMRVLDLGCGRAMSSIFLQREFGVQVWATDLWFSASENLQRIRDAGSDDGIVPIHADARKLPFAAQFFDAIISVDAFPYFGTDDLYLHTVLRFLKPGGLIGIAGAGLIQEINDIVPDHLQEWWSTEMCCLHSHEWWQQHWQCSGLVDLVLSDSMSEGWLRWLDWHRTAFPENTVEINAVAADAGRYLGYVRTIARRRLDVKLEEPVNSVSTQYMYHPILRSE